MKKRQLKYFFNLEKVIAHLLTGEDPFDRQLTPQAGEIRHKVVPRFPSLEIFYRL